MKKIIFILFILLCGISAVSAQTAQRTVKKPNFFMPQNAMQSQTTQNRAPQFQNTSTLARPTVQTAKTQPTAKLIKPVRTNASNAVSSTSATDKGIIQKVAKTPNLGTNGQKQINIKRPVSTPKQPLQTPEELIQTPAGTPVTNVVSAQNPQPESAADDNDPFKIIFTDYFKDTAAIDEGRVYQNPRLDEVIANFVDKEHTLN